MFAIRLLFLVLFFLVSSTFSQVFNVSDVSNVSDVFNASDVSNVSDVFNASDVFNVSDVSNVSNDSNVSDNSNVSDDSNLSDDSNVSDDSRIDEQSSLWERNVLLKVIGEGGWIMLPLLTLFFLSMVLILERLVFYTKNKIWSIEETSQNFLNSYKDIANIEYYEILYDTLQERSKLYISQLDKGLFLLGGIANVAPLMGFLGTVLGMIEAFSSIATATNVNAKVVALGIQKALVTTAAGLLIAVPAFIAYYIFSNLVQSVAAYLEKNILLRSEVKPRLLDSSKKEV